MNPDSPNAAAPTAAWLGYGGLIPFVLLAIATVAGGDYAVLCSRALFGYGAVILSFVGALHWGFAMTLPGVTVSARNRLLIWSTVPALLAWVAALLIPPLAAALLVAGFLAQYVQDRRLATRAELPAWYLPLRLRLTVVASLSLALGGVFAVYD